MAAVGAPGCECGASPQATHHSPASTPPHAARHASVSLGGGALELQPPRRERQRAYRQSFHTKRTDDPTKRTQQEQHIQQQQRQQQEQQAIAQRRWEAENPFAGYQPPANGPNDAWDD